MREYEYEVIFEGSQFTATVIVYHEVDTKEGEDLAARDVVIEWARTIAGNKGLQIDEYDQVSVIQTGVLN